MTKSPPQAVALETNAGPMQCQLFVPAGNARCGAVIVVPEAYGLMPAILDDCALLAEAGYLALGIEIFHRTAPAGFTSPTHDFNEVGPHFKALTNDGLAEDLEVARALLAQHPRSNGKLAVQGYCVGGFAAYLGACRTRLDASVVYYGGGIVKARPNLTGLAPLLEETPTCPVLGIFGADDPSIPAAERDALEAALQAKQVEHELITFAGAGHAFRNRERPNYRAEQAELAWQRSLAFLREQLG